MAESGERSRESLSERNLTRTKFSKIFEERGLTAENMNYLLEHPDLLDGFVSALKEKLGRHQSPGSKQFRAARERLDDIDPKDIYDTAMTIRETHGRLSIKAVSDAIDPGLRARLRFSTSRPRTLAQQQAYNLAEQGRPWPSESDAQEIASPAAQVPTTYPLNEGREEHIDMKPAEPVPDTPTNAVSQENKFNERTRFVAEDERLKSLAERIDHLRQSIERTKALPWAQFAPQTVEDYEAQIHGFEKTAKELHDSVGAKGWDQETESQLQTLVAGVKNLEAMFKEINP